MPFIGGGGGGGGGGYTPPAVDDDTLTEDEDVTLEGNVLVGDMTEVVKFSFRPAAGQPALEFQANETANIPARGTVFVGDDGALEVVPAPNVSGPLPTIRTWQTDGTDLRFSNIDVTFTPANDAPIANDAYALSFDGEAVEIDLLDFASDPDEGDTVTVTHIDGVPVVVDTPQAVTGGSVNYEGGGIVTVTPDVDVETVEFTYTVSDGTLTDTADVTVQVGVENIPLFSPFSPLLGNTIDQAAINFGKTVRKKYGPLDDNGVNVAVPPYSPGQGYFELTNREPWLYDRATTVWLLAKRTNDAAILADAMTLAEQYMAGVQVSGAGLGTFNIIGNTGGDPTDVKYLYGCVAWWYERERNAGTPGNAAATAYRARAQGLYRQTLISWNEYDGNTAELWTERNACFAILNCLAWYWISGDQTALDDATTFVEDVISLSGTGAPLHSKDKHESDGDPTLITSPWMGALLAEAMLQYHRTTDSVGLSVSVPRWLADYATWIHDHAVYVAAGDEEPELAGLAGLRIPAYLAGQAVQFPEGEAADMQHCVDVAGLIRKGIWALDELSEDTTDLEDLLAELEQAAAVDIAYWTRTTEGYPKYRVNPSRKYGWWFRARYSSVHSVGIVPFPPALITAPILSGSNQQGSTLSVTDGIWAGTPAPTFTYQWRRSGADIVGATNDTYVTDVLDIDESIDCVVTATNSGGEASADSNNITVVVAGSPEITVQPTNQQALVGEQAVFSLTATGTPAPTYQWQVSTNGGGAWNNVAEGTGDTSDTYTTEVLASDDDGDMYRCIVTNAGGSVTSDAVVLTMVVQQEAASFADSTDFGALAFTLGTPGFVDWTVGGFLYIDNVINSAQFFLLEGAASRMAFMGYDNSGNLRIGDSNTGFTGGGWDVDPPADTWCFFIFRGSAAHPGTFTGRWYSEDGTLGGTCSRANGIEDSLTVDTVHLNGGGLEPGCSMRAQYVRGYSRRLSDGECDAEFGNINMATAGLEWFNVFENNGGGGVAVRDATGNNREFTLTGATLSALGPVAPTV